MLGLGSRTKQLPKPGSNQQKGRHPTPSSHPKKDRQRQTPPQLFRRKPEKAILRLVVPLAFRMPGAPESLGPIDREARPQPGESGRRARPSRRRKIVRHPGLARNRAGQSSPYPTLNSEITVAQGSVRRSRESPLQLGPGLGRRSRQRGVLASIPASAGPAVL